MPKCYCLVANESNFSSSESFDPFTKYQSMSRENILLEKAIIEQQIKELKQEIYLMEDE
ncbi:MAG: hypothetical protein R3327_06790 [Nitrosopumilaceae archaeon]|nr:hypothetical protein [Nitrosopumilaceae archaeon]